jgi:hypothetical protein
MRGRSIRKLSVVLLIGSLASCRSQSPNLRTPVPEQYALPPSDDSRFSQPVSYPKETLNQDSVKQANNLNKLPSQQPSMAPGGRGGP